MRGSIGVSLKNVFFIFIDYYDISVEILVSIIEVRLGLHGNFEIVLQFLTVKL